MSDDWLPPGSAETGYATVMVGRPDVPTASIVFGFEQEPRVFVTSRTDQHGQDWERLLAWVESLPEEWVDIFRKAFELERARRGE